jgi:hypothetical protein
MRSRKLIGGALLSLGLFLSACSSSKTEEKPVAETDPPYTVTGNEGSISGTIAFSATAPSPKKIQMDSDPVCAKTGQNAVAEDVVVNNGKLANVFVYVKSGLPKNSFPASTDEVTLDQIGCRYVPHVVGLRTNQALKITNSDATAHNVHPVPQNNREWNESQYPGSPALVKKFPLEDIAVPVKCNQHSWMKAWVAVVKHPFFAVSAADGTFSIKGLPPGQYELEAWHEKLGSKTLQITVSEKGEAKGDFSFESMTSSNTSGLKIQPALIVH